MAQVTTTISPMSTVQPFAGFHDVQAPRSALARGEVLFSARNETIAATAAGDNQYLSINCDCPRNFAYVLVDLHMSLTATAGNTYNFPLGTATYLYDAQISANRTLDVPVGLFSEQKFLGSLGTEGYTYSVDDHYQGVIIPVVGDNVRLQSTIYNGTANDGIYNLDFVARFLQYDIEQAHHVSVNSAMPVRGH